jgi:hypothetical protein
MVSRLVVEDRILEVVRSIPGCRIGDLVRHCPELTWNQIFHEIFRLHNTGQIEVTPLGGGEYGLRLREGKPQIRSTVSSLDKGKSL